MVMHLRQLVHRASIAAVATAGGRPTFVPIAHATTRRLTSPLFFSSSSTAQQAPTTRYLLSYDYVPDVLEKRGPYREGHLGLAKAMIEGGTCVSGGPTSRPGEDVPKGGERRVRVCACFFLSHRREIPRRRFTNFRPHRKTTYRRG
jgi:hypothetical protein